MAHEAAHHHPSLTTTLYQQHGLSLYYFICRRAEQAVKWRGRGGRQGHPLTQAHVRPPSRTIVTGTGGTHAPCAEGLPTPLPWSPALFVHLHAPPLQVPLRSYLFVKPMHSVCGMASCGGPGGCGCRPQPERLVTGIPSIAKDAPHWLQPTAPPLWHHLTAPNPHSLRLPMLWSGHRHTRCDSCPHTLRLPCYTLQDPNLTTPLHIAHIKIRCVWGGP